MEFQSFRFGSTYNDDVARGWESKSIEAQQAEASERPDKPHSKMSAEEAALSREKETIRLARQGVLQQMETSANARHRQLLEGALADLDEKMRRLER